MFAKITAFFTTLVTAIVALFQGAATVALPITPKITVTPAVFDCGENYAVMWATNINATGTVTVEKNGEKYVFNDTGSGSLRTSDTFHVVRIDKDILDNSEYTASSQAVFIKEGYFALKGKTVSCKKTAFRGYHSQDEIKALTVSDVHENTKALYEAISHVDETPDVLFFLGDITSSLVKKSDFVNKIAGVAATVTKGEYPVIYARGNHETRGAYSSEMKNYFPTDTGEMYFKFNYGPISGVVLDFGEDKTDDNVEYSGLVDFTAYRNKEFKWLKTLEKDTAENVEYRIALCHSVMLEDHFGMNWENELKRIGTKFIVGGHTHVVNLSEDNGYFRYMDGGKASGGNYVLSFITFKDGKAKITAVQNNGETLYNNTINIGE